MRRHHPAQLAKAERIAHRAVPAGFVQSREPDLRSAGTRPGCTTMACRLVCEERGDVQRRHYDRTPIVLGNGFETVVETYGCHETPDPITPHAAGPSESRGVRLKKRQKPS